MHPTQPIEIFGNVLCHLVRWKPIDFEVKFYGDHPRGSVGVLNRVKPFGGGVLLNRRGVAKDSDLGYLQDYISETVQDRR